MSSEGTGNVIAFIKTGRKKATVRFESGESIVLSLDAFTEQPLYVGKVIDDEEMKVLSRLADEDKYYQIALKYVLKETHTTHQVVQLLYKKGLDEKTTYRIVHRLEQEGLINDALYADTYARDVAGVKLLGRNRIMMNLKEKGISYEIIRNIEIDRDRELSKARRYASLANKKYATSTNTKKMYKVITSLIRRGFDEDIAREAARLEFTAGDPELELQRLRNDARRVKARYATKYGGYELNRRVTGVLVRKGYPYENIERVMKEIEDEDFGNE